jgi:hypothetical protein
MSSNVPQTYHRCRFFSFVVVVVVAAVAPVVHIVVDVGVALYYRTNPPTNIPTYGLYARSETPFFPKNMPVALAHHSKKAFSACSATRMMILEQGLPDFSWYNIPKRGKYTPNSHKCTKWL